jgi:transposase-like protein
MATKESYEGMTERERRNRYFSEELRRKIVNDLDKKIVTIAEVCRTYQVSRTSVSRWIYRYSTMKKRGHKMVVEAESDTLRIQELKKKISELERAVGQKQVKIDYLEKMIELTEEDLEIKIKKKDGV